VAVACLVRVTQEAREHLRTLTARQRAIALDAAEDRLARQPTHETRNRKPMQPNPIATSELRVGNLRVYYDVQDEPDPIVLIRAISVKERDQVWIGGERSSF
jgi:mRNA-degrading endonuclease RelE of RelBE toxin-antitoxin system